MQAAPDVVNSVAGGVRRARVAVDIRVIDVRTARLLSAITAEGTATNVHLGVAKAPLSWLGAYTNTPMEHAVRVAIDESVEAIAAQTPPEYFHSSPVAAADALPERATSSEGRDGSP
jgi:curli biogenesis system outer membrane secretion channel CsgG